jgi:membrane associated rhomboid family serine protease
MIPLRDNNPSRSFPFVTILLIAINVFVFFTQPDQDKPKYEMVPAEVISGHEISGIIEKDPAGNQRFVPAPPEQVIAVENNPNVVGAVLPTIQPTWLTIFTAMFLHANFLHIAGNMLFLWIFGNNVEDAFGKVKYLLFYLFCGFIAAVAQIAVGPNSIIPTLGASGAIAGVLGAYAVMYPEARVLTLFTVGIIFLREVSAFWVLGLWILLQVFEGFSGLSGPEQGGVAYFAHIGGFIAGAIIAVMLGGRALGQQNTRPYDNNRYSQY